MTSMITTCTFCGLRFTSRPLLDLHIREDHLRHDHHGEPGRGRAASTRASQPGPGTRAREHGQASTRPQTMKEVNTMTATPQRHHRHAGRVRTALHTTIRAIADFHAEITRATLAQFRLPGAPQPTSRAHTPASPPEHPGVATGRTRQAA